MLLLGERSDSGEPGKWPHARLYVRIIVHVNHHLLASNRTGQRILDGPRSAVQVPWIATFLRTWLRPLALWFFACIYTTRPPRKAGLLLHPLTHTSDHHIGRPTHQKTTTNRPSTTFQHFERQAINHAHQQDRLSYQKTTTSRPSIA